MKTLKEDAEQALEQFRHAAAADSSPTLTKIYEKVAKVGLEALPLKDIEVLLENSHSRNRKFVEEHREEIDFEWRLKLHREYPTTFPDPSVRKCGCSLF